MPNTPKPSAVVFAKNVDRVATFYREMISMSVVHTDHDHVVLGSESMQLVIHGIPKEIADTIRTTDPPEVREGMPIKLWFAGFQPRGSASQGDSAGRERGSAGR